jgi:transposase InsO family protein
VPHIPDGLTITPVTEVRQRCWGTEAIMPDNGKAERFIQTALREWAYATAFDTSQQRRAELPLWLHRYNWHRPHASLGGKPPISRLPIIGNNLMTFHS